MERNPLEEVNNLREEGEQRVIQIANTLRMLKGNSGFKTFMDLIEQDRQGTEDKLTTIPPTVNDAPAVFAQAAVLAYQKELLGRIDEYTVWAQSLQKDEGEEDHAQAEGE